MEQLWKDKIKGENIKTTIAESLAVLRKGNFDSIKEEDEVNSSVEEYSYTSELNKKVVVTAKNNEHEVGNEDIKIEEPYLEDNSRKANSLQFSSENLLRKFEERRKDFLFEAESIRKSKTTKNTRILTVDEYLEHESDQKLHKSHMDNPHDDSKLAVSHRSGLTTPSDMLKPDIEPKPQDLHRPTQAKGHLTSIDKRDSVKQLHNKNKALSRIDVARSSASLLNVSHDKSHVSAFMTKPMNTSKLVTEKDRERRGAKVSSKSPFPHSATSKVKSSVFVGLKRPSQVPERKEKRRVVANYSASMRVDSKSRRVTELEKGPEDDKVNFLEF